MLASSISYKNLASVDENIFSITMSVIIVPMIEWSFGWSVVVLSTVLAVAWSRPVSLEGEGQPYPTCVNANQKCSSGKGCTDVPISFIYTEDYSPSNVLCINQGNDDASPVTNPLYRLRGCHTLFYTETF